ncbi:GNAT family N-acetyltransferase [Paenibacillus sp. FSL W7-1287]|uniref:GNAT family N-acetyltransferase n=1 Tax=Paenibacillus sp. FSL W7-1287 TaxID=2954538 RepID=UPI0030FA6578
MMNGPNLRALTTADFEESMKLSSFAFQYPLTAEQLEERRSSFLTDDVYQVGVFQHEQLCAQATLLHLNVYVNGELFSMGGIAGVSTWPEHRRHGYVARILKELLVKMKENGQSISMLHPFSFSFYRKYGWETYIEYKQYEMSADHLSSLRNKLSGKHLGTVKRVEDWQLLQTTYDRYAKRYNGMLQRGDKWWKESITKRKPGTYAGAYNDQGELDGYMIYEVANRIMTIHEFITLTAAAQQRLMLYIAQHDSMIDRLRWTAPSDDCFAYGLDNPRIKQELIPYFMARIVDVEPFIAQYPFEPSDQEEIFTLQISDEHAPWNNGHFELRIASSGKATLTKVELASPQVIISIGALTSWLLNYQKWQVLKHVEQLEGSEQAMKRLQLRIREHTTYLTDFF